MSLPGWGSPPLGPGLPQAGGPLGRARDALVGRLFSRTFDRGLGTLNAARQENGLAPDRSRPRLLHPRRSSARADQPGVRVRELRPARERPAHRPAPRRSRLGGRVDGACRRRAPRPGRHELDVHGARRRPAARGRARSASCRSEARHDRPGDRRRGDRGAGQRHGRRAAPPTRQVLREAAAVVTHGGHGTVIKTLAAGVPMVVMPLGRDQLDNAARVAHHGAGLRVSPKASAGEDRCARFAACSTSPRSRGAAGRSAARSPTTWSRTGR